MQGGSSGGRSQGRRQRHNAMVVLVVVAAACMQVCSGPMRCVSENARAPCVICNQGSTNLLARFSHGQRQRCMPPHLPLSDARAHEQAPAPKPLPSMQAHAQAGGLHSLPLLPPMPFPYFLLPPKIRTRPNYYVNASAKPLPPHGRTHGCHVGVMTRPTCARGGRRLPPAASGPAPASGSTA